MKIFYITDENKGYMHLAALILSVIVLLLLSLLLYQYWSTKNYIVPFTGKWCIDFELTKKETSYWKEKPEAVLRKVSTAAEDNIYEIQPKRIVRDFSYNGKKEKKCSDIKILSCSEKLLFIKTKEFADSDLLIVFYKISDHLMTATFILPGMNLANSPVYYMKKLNFPKERNKSSDRSNGK